MWTKEKGIYNHSEVCWTQNTKRFLYLKVKHQHDTLLDWSHRNQFRCTMLAKVQESTGYGTIWESLLRSVFIYPRVKSQLHAKCLPYGVWTIMVEKAKESPLEQQGKQKGLNITAKTSEIVIVAQYSKMSKTPSPVLCFCHKPQINGWARS